MTQPFFVSIPQVSNDYDFVTPFQTGLVATVPTLLVPYDDSLTSGLESRYKSLTDTKVDLSIEIEYLSSCPVSDHCRIPGQVAYNKFTNAHNINSTCTYPDSRDDCRDDDLQDYRGHFTFRNRGPKQVVFYKRAR